jgi:L-2-hydroxyglutarate oxidase LhgO
MQICIIGGGVVGLNIALELAAHPEPVEGEAEIFLLEQEKFLGHHTSTRNSEVIHAGFAYPPDSLKTKLCIEGNKLTYELLDKLHVPYKKCGKWIIACNDLEAEALEAVHKNAKICGVKGFKRAKVEDFLAAEPSAQKVAAVAFSETSGIMDAAAYIKALEVALSKQQNVNLIYPCKVLGIDGLKSELNTTRGPIKYDLLINSAGLWADEIHAMVCRNVDFQMCAIYEIVPFKGEYYTWRKGKIRTMIYPVPGRFVPPHPRPLPKGEMVQGEGASTLISSMGIHTHRNMAGELFIGPSQVKMTPDKKSDYTIQTPPEDFVNEVSGFLKDIKVADLEPAYAGNRPKLYKNGEPYGDFVIMKEGNVIHLLGMESPALTAAPAIAKYIKTHLTP